MTPLKKHSTGSKEYCLFITQKILRHSRGYKLSNELRYNLMVKNYLSFNGFKTVHPLFFDKKLSNSSYVL